MRANEFGGNFALLLTLFCYLEMKAMMGHSMQTGIGGLCTIIFTLSIAGQCFS